MDLFRRTLTIVVVVLVFALAAALVASACPPLDEPPQDPQPMLPSPIGAAWLDNIYCGDVPPAGDDNPVLVFVHGYASAAEDWWGLTKYDGVNDMYVTAYEAGYRTAFVSLSTDRQPCYSMWDNGVVLRLQLEAIARHYGVDQLDIVAHSKGGVDAQAAVAFFGGWQWVRHVFTLASPHQGSELADLAYTPWAWPIAEALGLHDDGVRTLQTGYMSLFRAIIDPLVLEQNVNYYSAAGTDIGPRFTGLRFLGRYLEDHFGPNDGIVTVASTELPGAETLFVEPYHHFNIAMGHAAFPRIDEILRGEASAGTPIEGARLLRQAPAPKRERRSAPLQSNVILRGGRLAGPVVEAVPVEPHARAATFDLLVSKEGVTAALTGPEGVSRSLKTVVGDGEGLFGTAMHRACTVSQPQAGVWTLQVNGPPGAAYLLITTIDSPLRVTLSGLPGQVVAPNVKLKLSADADESFDIGRARPRSQPTVRQINAYLVRSQLRPGGEKEEMEVTSHLGATLVQALRRQGIYTLSVTVTGRTAEGMPFERSFVHSLAVVKPETLSDPSTLLDR